MHFLWINSLIFVRKASDFRKFENFKLCLAMGTLALCCNVDIFRSGAKLRRGTHNRAAICSHSPFLLPRSRCCQYAPSQKTGLTAELIERTGTMSDAHGAFFGSRCMMRSKVLPRPRQTFKYTGDLARFPASNYGHMQIERHDPNATGTASRLEGTADKGSVNHMPVLVIFLAVTYV